MFVNKTIAFLSETHLGCSTLGQAPDLTYKHQTRVVMLARDKHPRLLDPFVIRRK
jgi:hypothetical protein